MESLIQFGGEVKSLDDGKVGGYLVYFSTADDPDKTSKRDFFTKDTDFGLDENTKSVVLYDHGLDPTLKARRIGRGEAKVDEIGVWFEAQLERRDDYEKAIASLAGMKKLCWSSGTATHLVERKEVKSATGQISHEIVRWPLGLDASLTPTPAEPRAYAVSLKSYEEGEHASLKSLLPQAALGTEGAPSVKAQYLGTNIENSASMAAVSRLNDALMYQVVSNILSGDDCYYGSATMTFSTMTPAEKAAYLTAAFDEFRDLSLTMIQSIAAGVAAETTAAAVKAIEQRYLSPAETKPRAVALLEALEFKSFLSAMGAVAELADTRLSWYEGERSIKQGRPISAENLASMQAIHAGLQSHVDKLGAMIEKHKKPEVKTGTLADALPQAADTLDDAARAQIVRMLFLDTEAAALTL